VMRPAVRRDAAPVMIGPYADAPAAPAAADPTLAVLLPDPLGKDKDFKGNGAATVNLNPWVQGPRLWWTRRAQAHDDGKCRW
jgi:hypothetical protein